MKNKIEETSIFLPADNHYHGFMISKLRFELLDSGVYNDLPLYPLVHPKRKVDVIMVFDSSGKFVFNSVGVLLGHCHNSFFAN
jgi:hypothetical protein